MIETWFNTFNFACLHVVPIHRNVKRLCKEAHLAVFCLSFSAMASLNATSVRPVEASESEKSPHPDKDGGSSCQNRDPNPALTSTGSAKPTRSRSRELLGLVHGIISYVPPNCRWDPQNPPRFSPALNILYGIAGCITVASLYYTHPILAVLALDFDVSDYAASQVPTFAQAGYAVGLLFICPLGDQLPRRGFVLLLVWLTGTLWCVDRCPFSLAIASRILAFAAYIDTEIGSASASPAPFHCSVPSPSLQAPLL